MNIIITDSKWDCSDFNLFDEPIYFMTAKDLPNLLVKAGVYRSTSQARRAGRVGDVPKGWTELKASKKHTLWIWNPQTSVEDYD
jgi:hypothetical protein